VKNDCLVLGRLFWALRMARRHRIVRWGPEASGESHLTPAA
jgi:hypothetical protein